MGVIFSRHSEARRRRAEESLRATTGILKNHLILDCPVKPDNDERKTKPEENPNKGNTRHSEGAVSDRRILLSRHKPLPGIKMIPRLGWRPDGILRCAQDDGISLFRHCRESGNLLKSLLFQQHLNRSF